MAGHQRPTDDGDNTYACLWGIFDLQPGASERDLRAAVRKLSLQYHPDKTGVDNCKVFAVVRQAYEILLEKCTADKHVQSSATQPEGQDSPSSSSAAATPAIATAAAQAQTKAITYYHDAHHRSSPQSSEISKMGEPSTFEKGPHTKETESTTTPQQAPNYVPHDNDIREYITDFVMDVLCRGKQMIIDIQELGKLYRSIDDWGSEVENELSTGGFGYTVEVCTQALPEQAIAIVDALDSGKTHGDILPLLNDIVNKGA